MNVTSQICGIFLISLIAIFYRRQKSIHFDTSRAFIYVLRMTLICLFFDVLSILLLNNSLGLPEWIVLFVDKSFFVSLIMVGFCGAAYICVDIYQGQREKHRRIVLSYAAIAVTGSIAVYCLPVIPSETNDFSFGIGVTISFAVTLLLMLITCFMLYHKRAFINPKRWEAMQIWLGLWITSLVINLFFNDLLIIGFTSAIGIMVLYIKLENPETHLDKSSGVFNQGALLQYMQQLFSSKKDFSMIVMVMEYSVANELNSEYDLLAKMEILAYLSKIKGCFLFKKTEDEVVLLFESEKKAEETLELLMKKFEGGWEFENGVKANANFIYLPDSSVVRSEEYIFYLIRYARHNTDLKEKKMVVVDAELVLEMKHEQKVAKFLREAMEEERVEVFYQPIYATKEAKFTSAEALVRIRDKDGKIVAPGEFIDVAEKNGMIIQLGEVVFEEVCKFIRDNNPKQYGLSYVEINLSVVQCADEKLADSYIAIIEKYGISPSCINLEITESASLKAKAVLLDNMKKLMDYGIRFSLDDFGTGQSNLNYIIDMPVDIVKFDRMMSNAYFENRKAKYVMDAAMHMIQGLQLEIVSEGIETEEQYKVMESLGINYIQGYYFSKPLAKEEFLKFLVMNS